ncbi:MAG: DUF4810 domain-containing protein [Gammaproteobacteria bacterium]|nr:DUF4810 domain-containing protein [Gammaproteobacteria bacterium]
MRALAVAIMAALALLTGCASKPAPMYAWGSYEQLMYSAWVEPGSVALEEQINVLEDERNQARAAGMPLPPGWHAHLGYLYVQSGRLDLAHDAFVEEKGLYPESAVFMDRLLVNMGATPPGATEQDEDSAEEAS